MMRTLLFFLLCCAPAVAEPGLSSAIAHLYPNAMADRDYRIQDDRDGRGPFIARWDATKLGARPTPEQIATAATAARDARKAAADAETAQKNDLAALSAKLEAGTITSAEQRALLKHLLRRLDKIESRIGK